MLTAFDINLKSVKSKGPALTAGYMVWRLVFNCPCGEYDAEIRVMTPTDALHQWKVR
jgi:hypothetical protein